MVIFGSWTVPGWYGLVLLFDILSHFELARSVEKLEMCVLTTRSKSSLSISSHGQEKPRPCIQTHACRL
uniref:Secreted protein n=1 Tax=Anguilla anguilla TaxID=7936 RepID=A0A0E9TVK7_ANGAN